MLDEVAGMNKANDVVVVIDSKVIALKQIITVTECMSRDNVRCHSHKPEAQWHWLDLCLILAHAAAERLNFLLYHTRHVHDRFLGKVRRKGRATGSMQFMGGCSEMRSRYAEHSDLTREFVQFVLAPVKYVIKLDVLDVKFMGIDPDNRSWYQ